MTALGLRSAGSLNFSSRRRRAAGGPPPFAPTSLSGLAVWLDAELSPVSESGGTVAQWDDLSGQGRHFAHGTIGERPIKTVDASGFATLRFDGSDDRLERAGGWPSLAAGTLFIVYANRSQIDDDRLVSASAGAADDVTSGFALRQATSPPAMRFDAAGDLTLSAPIGADRSALIVSYGAGTGSVEDDGGATDSDGFAGMIGAPDAIRLGGRTDAAGGGRFAHADFYAVGLYNRKLNATEIEQLLTYLKVRFALPPANPAQIADLAIWLDAADSPTIASGGLIERWDDLSGNGRHAGQASAGQRPAKITDGAGRTTLRFDGIDNTLSITTPPSLAGGLTMFVVFRMRTRVDFTGIVTATAATGVDHQQFFTLQNASASSNLLRWFGRSAAANNLAITRADPAALGFAILEAASGNAAYRDAAGMATDSFAGGFATPTQIIIGGRFNDTIGGVFGYAAIDLYEFGLYPRALNTTEKSILEAYLLTKYGL